MQRFIRWIPGEKAKSFLEYYKKSLDIFFRKLVKRIATDPQLEITAVFLYSQAWNFEVVCLEGDFLLFVLDPNGLVCIHWQLITRVPREPEHLSELVDNFLEETFIQEQNRGRNMGPVFISYSPRFFTSQTQDFQPIDPQELAQQETAAKIRKVLSDLLEEKCNMQPVPAILDQMQKTYSFLRSLEFPLKKDLAKACQTPEQGLDLSLWRKLSPECRQKLCENVFQHLEEVYHPDKKLERRAKNNYVFYKDKYWLFLFAFFLCTLLFFYLESLLHFLYFYFKTISR